MRGFSKSGLDSRLATLAAAAQHDVCGYSGPNSELPSPERFIYRAVLPGGGCTSLFKVLLTNVCSNDCAYCVNQVGRDCPRASFGPDELARTFSELHQRRLVDGIFLSSAIAGNATQTESRMVDAIAILRKRYGFRGYVHLKILPGADFASVEAACRLATRVSINMEAPTAHHLARLTSRKNILDGIVQPMRWVKKIVGSNETLVPSGQTTQFVVGAADETDRDLIDTVEALYREVGLRRAYFSAFSPVSQSRLQEHPATPPLREHRLYQTDWLLRIYGFSLSEVELALGPQGNLPLKTDPKLAIASKRPDLYPLDVNRASYEDLLRVPGIGPVSARRIVDSREDHSINSVQQLRKMKVSTRRAVPYLWFKGMLEWEKQMSFLPEVDDSATATEQRELAQIVS
jgi:predicted DNA-binding helix-hairpin-helix protein